MDAVVVVVVVEQIIDYGSPEGLLTIFVLCFSLVVFVVFCSLLYNFRFFILIFLDQLLWFLLSLFVSYILFLTFHFLVFHFELIEMI